MGILGNLFRPDIAKLLRNRDLKGLLAALQHSDLGVRWEAVLALNDGVMQPMTWAEVVLQLLKDPASIPILRSLLQTPQKTFATLGLLWSTAVEHPAEIKPALGALVETLIAALQDKESNVRDFAAKTLGQSGALQAVPPLIAALGDPHNSVRVSAAEALGALRDLTGIDALIEKLHTDLERHRRGGGDHEYESVVTALGGIKNARCADALASALAQANFPEVERLGSGICARESQIFRGGLTALGPLAVDPLIKLLSSEHARVRAEVCNALYHVPDPRAIPALMALLDDRAEYSSIFGEERVNTRSVYALGEIGLPAKDALIKAAASPDDNIRQLATQKLAKLGQAT
jgi:HEAT repeat protein